MLHLHRVVSANAADIALPVGPLVKLRDGTLVLDGSTCYIISNRRKLRLASVNDLVAPRYKTSDAIIAGLAAYESGGVVQSPTFRTTLHNT